MITTVVIIRIGVLKSHDNAQSRHMYYEVTFTYNYTLYHILFAIPIYIRLSSRLHRTT